MIEIKDGWGEVIHVVEAESLRRANLFSVDLTAADLAGATLHNAILTGATLNVADLREANLQGATLIKATLVSANLTEANLEGVSLLGADLAGANLTRADLTHAKVGITNLARLETLHEAKGLATMQHIGPSSLDHYTLTHCLHGLPDVFLEGCGYTPKEIKSLRAMYTSNPDTYYSCFISHAKKDEAFAMKLRDDLRKNNITCWTFQDDLKGGEEFMAQIKKAIEDHDKLLLVCSRRSLYRAVVVEEIVRALEIQQETGVKKLFPIRLDNHILEETMLEDARENVKSGQWSTNWVPSVKRMQIPSFEGWENDDALYTREFSKLLEALQKPARRTEGEERL